MERWLDQALIRLSRRSDKFGGLVLCYHGSSLKNSWDLRSPFTLATACNEAMLAQLSSTNLSGEIKTSREVQPW